MLEIPSNLSSVFFVHRERMGQKQKKPFKSCIATTLSIVYFVNHSQFKLVFEIHTTDKFVHNEDLFTKFPLKTPGAKGIRMIVFGLE